jgi:hypothetical protein
MSIPRGAGWSSGELAILRSVVYSSLFEYPLTLSELRRTLLESAQTEGEILRTYDASPRLRSAIEFRDGLFFPTGRGAWVQERWGREVRSLAFLQRHRRLLALICALPFVRLVALSGSLAALNADHRADLDLFVITRGRRAWVVTLAVILLARLTGRRRALCLNFVMTDDSLPLVGQDTYRRFVAANPFVSQFYPNFRPEDRSPFAIELGRVARGAKAISEWLLGGASLVLDRLSRVIYCRHLNRRAASWRSPAQVRLSADCVKLHTRSHRSSVLARFEDACREALATSAHAGASHPEEELVAP